VAQLCLELLDLRVYRILVMVAPPAQQFLSRLVLGLPFRLSAAAISASTSYTDRRRRMPPSPRMPASIISGLCSVTSASTAVCPSRTEFEIAVRAESVLSPHRRCRRASR